MVKDATKIARVAAIKRELESILKANSAPGAWLAIRDAVERAERRNGGDWKIDPLTAEQVQKYPDGTYKVPQIGHRIFINPTGAFRIEDLWAKEGDEPFSELPSATGDVFAMPSGTAVFCNLK